MTISRRAVSALLLPMLLLSLGGCMRPEPDSAIEEVLQLNNDILEDPLLKEMDALEASLLSQEAEPLVAEAAEQTAPAEVPKAQLEPAPAAVIPAAPAAAAPTAVPDTSAPAADTVAPQTDPFKKAVFGLVKRTADAGISLRVIETKVLTADELRRIKNGEKIPQVLLTDEVLRLVYSGTVIFEKMVNNAPVPASLAEVVSGQTVRVTLNRAGEITYLRIIRY